ncbi:MAG TPA: SH3 domain-containing protein [Polyangiaceae bacterium]|nr:SH3 domain-containing protein [Polyangiaceae bacterium]
MSFRKADGPLTVHVPSPPEDRPSWWGVAAIAVVGFAVGVAWPRLAGVRLGPSVPDGTTASASAVPPAPTGAPSAAAGAPAVPAAMPAPASSPPASQGTGSSPSGQGTASAQAAPAPGSVRVVVPHGSVFACKTAGGDSLKGAECGALPPALDRLVQPRLRKLADCPEAAGSSGVLHLVVRADFAHDALTVDLGRDKGLATATPLLACAKSALGSASLQGIGHENTRYSVAYPVTFGAPPVTSPAAEIAAPAPASAADGSAQVEWEVAIVRDAPHTTGKVLARLQHGTALRVGSPKDGWYPVKYGDGFTSEGWVYRGAIGR